MTLRFADAAPGATPGEMLTILRAVPGVTQVEDAGGVVTLSVQGDVNPLLRALATMHVAEMVFPEAQLEDIFLGYYQAKGGDA